MVEGRDIPSNLKYTKDHEWIRLEGDRARVGITDHAQESLHEVVYADLPKVGRTLNRGESFGTVESVKAVSEIYTPVSGEVMETNQKLVDSPELINQQPYGEGWLILMKTSNLKEETNSLMSAKEYEALLDRLSQEKQNHATS
jgi:glycine cleavage system H protein